MNKILPWLKANLISVIAVAVAIIAAPVMLYFSGQWSGSIRKSVETEVSSNIQQLEQLDVAYSIQPYLDGQEALSVRGAPNAPSVERFASLLSAVVDESGKVRDAAVELNKKDKVLLNLDSGGSERLFPVQKDESTRLRLLDRLIEQWPKAHEALLASVQAGPPVSAEALAAELGEQRSKEVARRSGGRTEKELSPADLAQITEMLGQARVDRYRRRASELAFYADVSAFKNVVPWDAKKLLPIETAWDWQHTYWVHQDLVRALRLANDDPLTGLWTPVYRGPVKRLESIVVFKPGEDPTKSSSSDGEEGKSGGGGGADDAAQLQPVYTLSHTGRAASPVTPNGVFDIRFADVTFIAAAADVPRVLAAFPKVNFMTVVGLEMEEVDPLPLLAQGYDMGSAPLVRAKVRVETVWLRSWLKADMPPSVRKALGIPLEPGTEAADASASEEEAPAPAKAPRPSGKKTKK